MTTSADIIAKTTGGGMRERRDGTSARDGGRARSARTRGIVVATAIGAALLGAVAACGGDASRRGASCRHVAQQPTVRGKRDERTEDPEISKRH